MHVIKINFKGKRGIDLEELALSVNSLLGDWVRNGQILGDQFSITQTENGLEVYVNTPDSNSLDEKFNNKYVNEYLSEIIEQKVIFKIIVLGEVLDSAKLCDCSKINKYILFTTYVSWESPLKCFDCFGVVPLYKIPKADDEEYSDILGWQSNYQDCDGLQMSCRVGERFATNQMSRYDSELTKQGLEVCQSIKKVTGKKVFYYLYKYRAKSYKSELLRKCPNCGGDWHLKEPLHGIFDFKCEKCNLLSNIAWDFRT